MLIAHEAVVLVDDSLNKTVIEKLDEVDVFLKDGESCLGLLFVERVSAQTLSFVDKEVITDSKRGYREIYINIDEIDHVEVM